MGVLHTAAQTIARERKRTVLDWGSRLVVLWQLPRIDRRNGFTTADAHHSFNMATLHSTYPSEYPPRNGAVFPARETDSGGVQFQFDAERDGETKR
jgi:hypothetical protein